MLPRWLALLCLLPLALAALVACGDDDDDDDTGPDDAATDPAGEATPAGGDGGGNLISITDSGDFGAILTDASGLALYTFDNDEDGVSNCYDQCATAWPPLTTDDDSVTAPESLDGELTLIERTDGTMQVALDGQPLYTYAADSPGNVTGDGVGGAWHVATASAAGDDDRSQSSSEDAPDAAVDSDPYGYY